MPLARQPPPQPPLTIFEKIWKASSAGLGAFCQTRGL